MSELTETDDGALVVPDEVYRQLEATRQTGAVNMMMEIHSGLRQLDFREAEEWVKENEQAYYEHCLEGGFVPESEYEETEPLPSDEVK